MIENDKYYELIVKELSDGITEKEQNIIDEENAKNPLLSQKYSILKIFWNHFFPLNKPHHIIEKTEKKLGFTYRNKAKSNSSFAIRIAVSILLVLSLGFSAYQVFKPKQEVTFKEFLNNTNNVQKITLFDGTQVWLNSMSSLLTIEPFINNTREVKLIGEAYFEVAPNPKQPFFVKSDDLQVKVLGTHFNISAYPGDLKHEVSLYEGKVQLLAKNNIENKIFLTSGKKASYSSKSGLISVTEENGKPAEWRDGILRFYDEDFNTICKKLERKYNTKILIADQEIGNLHFTANFDVEPLNKILELLKKAHNFSYLKINNGIIIKSTI